MAVVTFTPAEVRRLLAHPPTDRTRVFSDQVTIGLCLEVRTTGNATWYFRYRDHDRRIRNYRIGLVDDCSLDTAREEVLRLRRYVKEGGNPAVERRRPKAPQTLRQFVDEVYLPHIRHRKRSWKSEVALLNQHVLPVFGDQPMQSIRRIDIARWQEGRLEAGYAVGTCNRMLVQLRHIFNSAIHWEMLDKGCNPTQGVQPLPGENKHERFLSQEEVARLLRVLDEYRNLLLADIIRMLLFTGARKREILDARWEHVSLEDGMLTVPRAKSGKPRHVVLASAAIEILQRQPRSPDQPWVFPSPRTGKPFVSIHWGWDTIRRRAGMPELRMHDLRHSFASFLVNNGRSLYEVQMLLGHASPQTTMRYAHLSRDSLRNATESIIDSLQGAGK